MKFRKLVTALGAAALFGASVPASAIILVENWVIDLGSIGNVAQDDFTGFGVFGPKPVAASNGIESLAFQALYHAVIAGPLAAGTLQHTDVAGNVTSATGPNGAISASTTAKVLNSDFELTFISTTTQVLLGAPDPITGVVLTSHLGAGAGPNSLATNGLLNIYADVITGVPGQDKTGTFANTSFTTGGAGMNDGFLIATFEILNAYGQPTGSFNPSALDGQDDASFKLIFNSGAVKDSDGNALELGRTLAFIDSNTDADPDGNGVRNTNPTNFPGGGTLGTCGRSEERRCRERV